MENFKTLQQSAADLNQPTIPAPTQDEALLSEHPGGLETPNPPWVIHQSRRDFEPSLLA